MSDAIQYIDTDDEQFDTAPRALRDAYERLKKSHQELTKETSTLRGQVTSQALSGVLSEFKSPERVKSALLADKVDPADSGAVAKWLEENGDDFVKGSATSSSTPAADPEAQAHARLNADGALTPAADLSKFEAASAEITPDMNGEQIKAIYRKHGI